MNKPRFVLDTSVIVSAALLSNSVPRRAFEAAIQQGEVLFADGLQAELSDVLMREKFDRYVSREKRLHFLASFVSLTVPVVISESIDVCRDPKDNIVLEVACSGGATCIVTGDEDMLALAPISRRRYSPASHVLGDVWGGPGTASITPCQCSRIPRSRSSRHPENQSRRQPGLSICRRCSTPPHRECVGDPRFRAGWDGERVEG